MKLITPLIFLLATSSFAQIEGNSQKINQNNKPKYVLENATINYVISGDGTGDAVLHFDRNGWRSIESRNLTISRYGVTSTERTIELIDGDYIYKANIDSKKGKKSMDKSWSGLLNYKSKEETLAAIMQSRGATKSGEESLLDKTCTVWQFESGTISELWEWEGVPLKIVKKLPGITYEITAQSIEELKEMPQNLYQELETVSWSQ